MMNMNIDSNGFIMLPGTTKFIRKHDINSITLHGKVVKETSVIPPPTKHQEFKLISKLILIIQAVNNIQTYKPDIKVETKIEKENDTSDKNADEDFINVEIEIVDLERIEIMSQTYDLLSSAQFAELSDKSRNIVESKIEFYKKTMDLSSRRNNILQHIQTDTNVDEYSNDDGLNIPSETEPKLSRHEIALKEIDQKIATEVPKQADRIASIRKRLNKTEVAFERDNLFSLTNHLFDNKIIDHNKMRNINNEVRGIATLIHVCLNGKHSEMVEFVEQREENLDNESTNEEEITSTSYISPTEEMIETIEDE